MADSLLLFDVFGDHTARKNAKNVLRQPLSNENRGKTVFEGPVKPNEPTKKAAKLKPGEPMKSFLSNAGKALQSTPARQVFSPKIEKASPMIYTEEKDEGIDLEEMEFTKPTHRYDSSYDRFESPFKIINQASPPGTPPSDFCYSLEPAIHDDISFSDFSIDSLLDEDLGLVDPY